MPQYNVQALTLVMFGFQTVDRRSMNLNVQEIMEPWMHQLGFPVVTVKIESNQVSINSIFEFENYSLQTLQRRHDVVLVA